MPASSVSKRLTESMAREVQELIYQPRLDNEIENNFEHIVDVNQAHLLMLAKEGLISAEIGRQLAKALIDIECRGAAFISRDASREDAHFNFEATLMNMVGQDAGGRLHVGRSRNDMGATIDRMRARKLCLLISERLNGVRLNTLEQARSHAKVVMPGYTHLQAAQPITLGFYCLGIEQALARDYLRFKNSIIGMNHSAMGAAAFSGTKFPVNRPMVAELLGFDGIVEHSLDAVASRDFLSESCMACVTLGTTWTRLVQDLYIWATDEFNLIEFPDRVSGASSIMPHKKNPVVLEYLKATGAQIIGDMVSMCSTIRATHFTNTIDGVRASPKGAWQVLQTTADSLVLVSLIMETIKPKPENMLKRVRESFSTITDLAESLVQDYGISFRDSHHIAGTVVRLMMEQNISADAISSAIIESAAMETIGTQLYIKDSDVEKLLDPNQSVESRRSRGGPSHKEVSRILATAEKKLAKDIEYEKKLRGSLDNARVTLKKDIKMLASE